MATGHQEYEDDAALFIETARVDTLLQRLKRYQQVKKADKYQYNGKNGNTNHEQNHT